MTTALVVSPIRVGVLEKEEIFRAGLTTLISQEPDFECVGVWGNWDEARPELESASPDVLLLDIKMPGRSSFELIRLLASLRPQMRLLVTVDCAEASCVVLHPTLSETPPAQPVYCPLYPGPDDCFLIALKLGAQGVIRKQEPFAHFVEAIRALHSGHYFIEADTANRLSAQYLSTLHTALAHPATYSLTTLTVRERQIVEQITQGHSNKEIASELQISYDTVKHHISRILEKLQLSDRTQIALYAVARQSAKN